MICLKTKEKCPNDAACIACGECLRISGVKLAADDMSASQPNPTPQVPAAPTLEQLAERVALLEEIVANMARAALRGSSHPNA